jgi:FkbM family methyltransferase
MIAGFKRALKSIARSVGYDIVRYPPKDSLLTSGRDARVLESGSPNFVHLLNRQAIDLVFDVGANTGQYALSLIASGFIGRIISIEPTVAAHAQLTEMSKNYPFWQVAERCAVGDCEGEAEINVSVDSEASSLLPILEDCVQAHPNARYSRSEKVRVRTLDALLPELLQDARAPFLKLDVQGFEAQALAGARTSLALFRGLQVELSFSPLYQGQLLFDEMVQLIKDTGFELFALLPGFTDPRTGRLLQVDGVFFRTDNS